MFAPLRIGKPTSGRLIGLLFCAVLLLSGCNYHYHTGLNLEAEGRFEEANIEYHRAYTRYPDNETYRDAFQRTAQKTTTNLMDRYQRYVKEKKYAMAFRRLEQAQTLLPNDPQINIELKKWYRILVAGKVDLVQIKSLQDQIPLMDQILLMVRLNTPNALKRLEAPVDYQTGTFYVEDILYDPPQDLLMLYSLNSIGVKLVNNTTRNEQFKRFVDFKTPVLIEVRGDLKGVDKGLEPVSSFYPLADLRQANSDQFWYPSRGIRYALHLDGNVIKVSSSVNKVAFLPQLLYINKRERRFFLDFGRLQLYQKKAGGVWLFRRLVDEKRGYLKNLQKNLLLNTYFFFREGGYPFIVE